MAIRDPAIRVNIPFRTTARSKLKYRNQMQSQGLYRRVYGGDLGQRQSKSVEQWKVGPGCFQKEVHWSQAIGWGYGLNYFLKIQMVKS